MVKRMSLLEKVAYTAAFALYSVPIGILAREAYNDKNFSLVQHVLNLRGSDSPKTIPYIILAGFPMTVGLVKTSSRIDEACGDTYD